MDESFDTNTGRSDLFSSPYIIQEGLIGREIYAAFKELQRGGFPVPCRTRYFLLGMEAVHVKINV